MSNQWKNVGAVDPRGLVEARMQQHYASQIASAVGRTFLPKKDDDSHTNLSWIGPLGAMAGHATPGRSPMRAAVELASLRLLLLDGEARTVAELPLDGRTFAEAEAWMEEQVAERSGNPRRPFSPLHYEMPAHGLGGGALFALDPAPSAELARWFANAAPVLETVRAEHSSAPVQCWPHHFDVATLIEIDEGRTIGVGLSPGDGSYPEPYWYVGPWPHPSPAAWPALAGGKWHTAGFVAAVLTGSELVGQPDQPAALSAFLRSAIDASRALLESQGESDA